MKRQSNLVRGVFFSLCIIFSGTSGNAEPKERVSTKALSSSGTRITGIVAYDLGQYGQGADSTLSVDVVRTECLQEQQEPFYDTLVGITIDNTSPFIVRFNSFRYKVLGKRGQGKVRSKKNSLASIGEIPPLESKEVVAFLLDANGNGKRYAGRKKELTDSVDFGIKNIQFVLIGENSAGQKVRVTGRTALSFDEINRCDG